MLERDDNHTSGRGPRPGDGSRRRPRAVFVSLALACGLIALSTRASAPAAKRPSGPRTAEEITQTLAQGPHAGECERCHTTHAGGSVPLPYALVGSDDNSLCDRCHTQAFEGGSYGGPLPYVASAHGTSATMIWPGPDPPARNEPGAAGKCVNCHDPHGRTDGAGVIPALEPAREEQTCLACHDGAPAMTNVRAQFQKAFRHPTTDFSGRHTGALESQAEDFGTTPINRRHAECEDCHNPHLARADEPFSNPLRPSNTLLGTSRVIPLNGMAGTPPSYTFAAGEDTLSGPPAEYQLCFKCHSSFTTQPGGQTDLARVLNPANPSFHPVEGPGQNSTISPGAFAAGWSTLSRTGCGDCHGDDFDPAAGPHGSNYRYILKRPYTASSATRAMSPSDQCFGCHAYDVYANPNAPDAVRAASRFNAPGTVKGHAEHVGELQVPCYACHVTHGSETEPHLMVTGRAPGLTGYTETATGGDCTSTCHGPQSYTVVYAR